MKWINKIQSFGWERGLRFDAKAQRREGAKGFLRGGWVLFFIWGLLVVVGCAQEEPTPVPEPTAEPEPTSITSTTPPVNLVAPLPEAEFEGAGVTLEWEWIRKLGPNEQFDVRVWREGEPELGITRLQQPRLNLTNWLIYQTPGTYFWRVDVVQVENGETVRTVSEPVEARTFTVGDVSDPAKRLTVPEGFEVEFVGSLNSPTSLQVTADGTLYVATLGGEILVQRPENRGDTAFDLFGNVTGITTGLHVHDGTVYVSHGGQVTALRDTDGDMVSDEATELFEEGVLPGVQYDAHSNNGLLVAADGMLYVTVGGTTDHGPEEHPLGGTILRVDLASGEFEVFARGLRNPYDIVQDAAGNLYAGDNGADAPDGNMLSIPPDELNWIQEGLDYGYPDYFGMPPEGSGIEGPLVQIPASSATTGLLVYDGAQFPEEYAQAMFITMWGNAVITHPTGHRVGVVRRTAEGEYVQENLEDFATGLQRPIDVTQTETGSILVADFEVGFLYEIRYVGEGE